MMNRVVIVKDFPPGTKESDIVAALKVYGNLKSFGMFKNLGFADFYEVNNIPPIVVVNGWKVNLFYGDSITKKYREPARTTLEQEARAFEQNDLSGCTKYRLSFDRTMTDCQIYAELVKEIGSIKCFSRDYIWLDRIYLGRSNFDRFRIVLVPESPCYKCNHMNDSDFISCISCGTKREICKHCNFENIPGSNYCSGCGTPQKTATKQKSKIYISV